MLISQLEYSHGTWSYIKKEEHGSDPLLILLFADRHALANVAPITELKNIYPNASIVSVSTSGNFHQTKIAADDALSATVIGLEKSTFRIQKLKSADLKNSEQLRTKITEEFEEENLSHMLVFSEGIGVNGSTLTFELNHVYAEKVSVTGGIAGDSFRF